MIQLIADRSSTVRRAAAALILGLAYFGITLPTYADECAAPAFVPGKTTLAQAREMWTSCNASTVSEGIWRSAVVAARTG